MDEYDVNSDQFRRSVSNQISQTTGFVVSQDRARRWTQPCELPANLHRRTRSIDETEGVEVWRLRWHDLQAEMPRLRNESTQVYQTKQRRREPLVYVD
jgi:hypothetical protein